MNFIEDVLNSTTLSILAFFIISLICGIMLFFYRKVAISTGILANPNFRSLHESPIPKGGGIVFAIIFSICTFILWKFYILPVELFMILGVGGFAATIFGFLDDIYNFKAIKKLFIQILFSVWTLYWIDRYTSYHYEGVLWYFTLPFIIFFLVWIINAYNFMDGIDGMAISGAIYLSASVTLIILLTNKNSELVIVFFLLMASVTAFVFFNWQPASIFMGDSGSIFLGYVFGSCVLITVARDEISLWTWLVLFGYFFADTTSTLISRLILVKKWYSAHRSHAYQNLARIIGNHKKVTVGVIIYHITWLLPLSFWTVLQPEMSVFAVALSIIPALIVSYRYGPFFSSS